jgi:hypothetical protein
LQPACAQASCSINVRYRRWCGEQEPALATLSAATKQSVSEFIVAACCRARQARVETEVKWARADEYLASRDGGCLGSYRHRIGITILHASGHDIFKFNREYQSLIGTLIAGGVGFWTCRGNQVHFLGRRCRGEDAVALQAKLLRWDVSDDSDRVIMDGLQIVCEVPRELERILHLEVRGKRVIVYTASGIQFIVPRPQEPPDLDGPQAWDL